MKHSAILLAAGLICGCATTTNLAASEPHSHAHPALPAGSNEMLRSAISAADGLDVIISDVIIPPGAQVPRHYHPGEEFVYIIEGSAVHVEEGKPDQLTEAGQAFVIPPQARHAPIGGPDGARAIVFRVHTAGSPERILTDD